MLQVVKCNCFKNVQQRSVYVSCLDKYQNMYSIQDYDYLFND